MIRNPEGLTPFMLDAAKRVERSCAAAGFELLIYCTFRSLEEQARLYRQGRRLRDINKKAQELAEIYNRPDLAQILLDVGPQQGRKIKTNAGPGQSLHNYKLAFDAVPMRGGQPAWGRKEAGDKKLWQIYGQAVRDAGLNWAGDWKSFKEFPHAQSPSDDWRKLIKEGTQ